jgi:Ca2+-binding RTX toxin-like protein
LVFETEGKYFFVMTPRKGGRLRALYAATRGAVESVSVTAGGGDDFLDASDVGYRPFVLNGGAGDDRIVGSYANDNISGGKGDDKIAADDGDDFVTGGPGDDTLVGEDGDDTLVGDPGRDNMIGGMGDDFLDAKDGAANDYVVGDEGYDVALADRDTRYEKEDNAWERNSIYWGNGEVESVS